MIGVRFLFELFDAHCDTVCKAYERNKELFENDLHLDLKRLVHFKTPVQFFALWLDKAYLENPFEETMKRIDFYYEQLKKNEDIVSHCSSYDDILKNKKEGKICAVLSIEGGEAIEGSIEKLHKFYKKGVRAMTLTWNYKNEIGNGAGEKSGGITEFGIDVISEMERLGMIVDVSHLNDESFWDVVKYAKKPFIASHSNSRKKTNVKRNLTDAQLKAIANSGGVVGINMCPIFLTRKPAAVIDDICIHIDHIMKVIGSEHIGIGCDFDGIDSTPKGLEDVLCVEKLMNCVENNFGTTSAKKMFNDNFMALVSKLW